MERRDCGGGGDRVEGAEMNIEETREAGDIVD